MEKDNGCQNCFSTTISSDLKPGPWLKQPSAQHTASLHTTAGYYSVTIFQFCSASTVDDPATSDSFFRSDVLHRCVWRQTSGSASDGCQAAASIQRSGHVTESLSRHLFRSPQCRLRRDGELFVHQVGRRREPMARKGPTSSW